MKKEISDQAGPKDSQIQDYEFINKDISRFLLCPACKLLMKNPMRLHPCGHTFCDNCAPKKGKCPQCKYKIAEVQRDLVGQGLVNEMFVKCKNGDCAYKGTYEDFKKYHQGKCKLQEGLDLWMENMKNSLQDHGEARIKQRFQSENQSGQNANFQLAVSQKKKKGQIKRLEINWDDQPFSRKQLRKQI